jgi:hypothetical protein
MEYIVNMSWDEKARVWIAVCDDIPVALESDSFDALVERVKIAAPELLQLNGMDTNCVLRFVAERREDVA